MAIICIFQKNCPDKIVNQFGIWSEKLNFGWKTLEPLAVISGSVCDTTRASQQNTHFTIYIETSKWQKGSSSKDYYPKCFKTTNFDRFFHEE